MGEREGVTGETADRPAEGAPPPRAASPSGPANPDIAPETPQPERVANRIKELLKDDQKAKELEQETGMSRDELDQFVRKFDRAPDRPAGDARELPIEPGKNESLDPRQLGPLPGATVSSRSDRGPNTVPQDAAGGNTEGVRTAVPSEWRSRYEAYRNSISRGKGASAPRPAAPGSGGR